MNLIKTTILALLALLPQTGRSAADSYQLVPEAQVDSSGIFLDQIVLSSGASRLLPHTFLARAPRLGETASFSQNDVALLAQTGASGLQLANWSGAASVRVSRRTRVLEASDLLDLLTTTLQKEYVKNQGELELHLTRAWPKPEVPDEPLKLKVTELPTSGVCPSFIVTFELWTAKENAGSWQTPLRASVWRDIPVAHSTLLRGQPLRNADVTMERADVLIQRDAFMNFPTSDDSLELAETIPTGRPILSHAIHMRPLVLRGQMVEGIFQDGALAISLMVETLEDGALGQTVRVRNPKTMRELFGKVENEKTIRITL
jgi:flagella basal body P-ring formation protein FlgA